MAGTAQHLPTPAPAGPAEWTLRALCVGAALGICVPATASLPALWTDARFMGHGYLIPLVSLFLLFSQRAALRDALREGEPARHGALVVLATSAAMVLAVLGSTGFVAGMLIPAVLLATAYALAGVRLARASFVPIAFLALMTPPPRFLTTELLFRLKLLVTDLSVSVLRALDYTVAASGNQVLLPGHELFVADACSGLASIITLLPLSAVIAYFLCRGIWRRLVIIGAVVPLAIAGNVVRIVVTVALVSRHGIEYAQGLLHESFGLTTFALGTLCLSLLARVLDR